MNLRARRPLASRLLALLAAGALAASDAAGDAPAKRKAPKPRAAASARAADTAAREEAARPDAALYVEAQRALATLKATASRQSRRPEWEQVVLRYRRVVARYPQSGFADNALLAVGDLYRAMARRFQRSAFEDDAVAAYRSLVAEYPSSRLGEKALFSIAEIAAARKDRAALATAVRGYLAAYPEGARAKEARAMLKQRAKVEEASLPAPPKPGLAQVFNLRSWSGASSTRVVIDVERQVPLRHDRITDPDRLWIDLDGARLHPNLVDRSFPVGDGLLEKVRIAQNRDSVVRVVLDFKDVRDHTIFYLENPMRLVIDVRGTAAPRMASAERRVARVPDAIEPPDLPADAAPAPLATPTPRPVATPTPAPPPAPASVTPSPSPTPRLALWTRHDGTPVTASPTPSPSASPTASPVPWASATPPPAPRATPTPSPVRAASRRPARNEREEAVPAAAPALPPAVNRAGSYSLARQLGLGARTIVIDAGHGGHDPGSLGRGGLQEKDLVLDIALRVEKRIRAELGADVVMTRDTDVFVPLEERTAIANAKGADLFLSIHANSSRNSGARGIETYFLSFAQDPHAEAVAARENAVSAATMKDLTNLVKAITLNSNLDESRDFAASVQESMMEGIRSVAPEVRDRGVRTAPFYVLIGANMPSVLAEISFVSNPSDEKLLRTEEHRERIAESLFSGVSQYLQALSAPRGRQLTRSGARATVVSGERR